MHVRIDSPFFRIKLIQQIPIKWYIIELFCLAQNASFSCSYALKKKFHIWHSFDDLLLLLEIFCFAFVICVYLMKRTYNRTKISRKNAFHWLKNGKMEKFSHILVACFVNCSVKYIHQWMWIRTVFSSCSITYTLSLFSPPVSTSILLKTVVQITGHIHPRHARTSHSYTHGLTNQQANTLVNLYYCLYCSSLIWQTHAYGLGNFRPVFLV